MIKNKLKFFYKKKSNSSPLIIFIHGAACDHTLWAFQNRYFYNRNYSTLLIDLPGHGENINNPLSSIKSMSNLVIDLIKKLSYKKVYLVGHSMGSLICLNTAIENISLIKKVILIGVSYPMQVNDILLKKSKSDQNEAIQDMINWSLTSNIKLNGANLIGINLPNLISVVMSNTKKGVLYKDLLACQSFTIDERKLKKLNVPFTIIAGENDIMTPINSSKNLNNILKNSSMHVIKGVGHFHTLESPLEVNKIIEGSLSDSEK